MLALPELQNRLARALLGQEPWPSEWIVTDDVPPELRLGIHRNNIFASLTESLRKTFPAVCRVVDERFFGYAAAEFIKNRPPRRAYLAAYGDEFPSFLRRFPPCAELPYLADLARFEWLLHRAAHADSPPPLAASALGSLRSRDLLTLSVDFSPSFGFLRSRWPIDRIWRANTSNGDGETIDLGSGGVSLEVRRLDDTVGFRALASAEFAFRLSLQSGCSLETASALARAADARFDLAAALVDLFREQALIGFNTPGRGLGAILCPR